MGGEEQKQKRVAAASYDYENDPRWADYWSNILIPPNMASRSDVLDHFKHKFYQRYIVRSFSLPKFMFICASSCILVVCDGFPLLYLQLDCFLLVGIR